MKSKKLYYVGKLKYILPLISTNKFFNQSNKQKYNWSVTFLINLLLNCFLSGKRSKKKNTMSYIHTCNKCSPVSIAPARILTRGICKISQQSTNPKVKRQTWLQKSNMATSPLQNSPTAHNPTIGSQWNPELQKHLLTPPSEPGSVPHVESESQSPWVPHTGSRGDTHWISTPGVGHRLTGNV